MDRDRTELLLERQKWQQVLTEKGSTSAKKKIDIMRIVIAILKKKSSMKV